MVLHGGVDGQLVQYGLPDQHVFDWTMDELRTLDIGEGETMPTLHELLTLTQEAPEMLLNIELKGPRTESYKPRYDFDLACEIVADYIDRFQVAHRTMVSSFEPLITNTIKLTPNR